MRTDPTRLDLDAIVRMPPRRRSRARAAINLLGALLFAATFAYGAVWLGGALLSGVLR